MLNSYLDLFFEVIKKNDDSRYTNGKDVRLVNLGTIALFSNFNMTRSGGKHLEDISHSHIVSLTYNIKTSSKNNGDLSIGFHRSRNMRKDELAQNKNVEGKNHVKIMLKDILVFAECQENPHMASVINLL